MSQKRLILHIGAHKTGTTALQVFFSQHADQLRQAGIDYPFVESQRRIQTGRCAGNLACMLEKMGWITNGRARFDSEYSRTIDHLVETVESSDCDTVLFSRETFCKYPPDMVGYMANRCKGLQVSVVLFVRDPFDFTLSMWKQHVKRFTETRDLPQYIPEVSRARTLEMFTGFERFSQHFTDLRLVNYDHCKRNIFSAFMQAAAIDERQIPALQAGQKRFANASLTHSQARLITEINQQYGQCSFAQEMINYLIRQAPARQEDFYSSTLHQLLLQEYAAEIAAINAHLPQEQQLAMQLRPDQDSDAGIRPEDRATLDDFVHRASQLRPSVSLMQRLRNRILRQQLKSLPINFDPAGYRTLNPDLPQDIDPYSHYNSHGLSEGRPYRVARPV